MRALLGLFVIVGIGCMLIAAVMALQATPLTALDFFIIGAAIIITSVGLKG